MKRWKKFPKETINKVGAIIATMQTFEPINQSIIASFAFRYPSQNNCIDMFIYFQEFVKSEFFADLLLETLAQSNDLIEVRVINQRVQVTFKNPELFNEIIADNIGFFEEIDKESKEEIVAELKDLINIPLHNVNSLQSLAGALTPREPVAKQDVLIERQQFINQATGKRKRKGKEKEELTFEFLDPSSHDAEYDIELELAIAASLVTQTQNTQLEIATSSSSASSSSASSSNTTTTITTDAPNQKLWKRLEKQTHEDIVDNYIVFVRFAPIAKPPEIKDITLAYSENDDQFSIGIQLNTFISKDIQKLLSLVDSLETYILKTNAVFHFSSEVQALRINFAQAKEEFLQEIFNQVNSIQPLDNHSKDEMIAELQNLKPKVCQGKGKNKEKSYHSTEDNSLQKLSFFPPLSNASQGDLKKEESSNVLKKSK